MLVIVVLAVVLCDELLVDIEVVLKVVVDVDASAANTKLREKATKLTFSASWSRSLLHPGRNNESLAFRIFHSE